MILILTAAAMLPAIIYLSFAKPQYTSTSKLLISRSALAGVGDGRTAGTPLPSGVVQAQTDVIASAPVIAAALAEPGVEACDPLRGRHELIETLKRALRIAPAEGGVITLAIDSSDPNDATCILGAVVQSYQQFLSATRKNVNNEATTQLEQSKARVQEQLQAKRDDLLKFGQGHRVGAADDGGSSAAELQTLEESVSEAHVAAVRAKAAADDLQRQLDANPSRAQALKWFLESSPASARTDSDDEELIRRELLALKARQAELEQRFMPGHPSLVRIAQRIEDLNLEHDASILRRAQSSADREAELQTALQQAQLQSLQRQADQSEYHRREAEIDQLQAELDELNHRIATLNDSPADDLPAATVIDPPRASAEPTGPDRRRILLVSALAGLSASCLLALFLERGRVPAQRAQANFLLPVLAEMPELPQDFGPLGRGLQTLAENSAALEEIFDGLGATLDGARARGRGVTALITSPSRGDGKSTLAANFAVYLAQKHKRVLLVDANMRTPSLARMFDLQDATGLSTLLEAEVSIPITAIFHTGVPSLDVVPAGPLPRRPAELVNSERLNDLLADLAERYDYVLLDSPPSVAFTDARTLSASVDITLLVQRADVLNRRIFDIAREGLVNIGANLCGIALNLGLGQSLRSAFLDDVELHSLGVKPQGVEASSGISGLMLEMAKAVDRAPVPARPSRVSSAAPRNGLAGKGFAGKDPAKKGITKKDPADEGLIARGDEEASSRS
jgi:capsular exopolysaccharide synthesis family protein